MQKIICVNCQTGIIDRKIYDITIVKITEI